MAKMGDQITVFRKHNNLPPVSDYSAIICDFSSQIKGRI
ncbi:hypothetical protein [Morganella morganii IS15]|nr:hypothetical protein [Morganella morganii IS15]